MTSQTNTCAVLIFFTFADELAFLVPSEHEQVSSVDAENLQGASVTIEKHISFPHCFLQLQPLSLVNPATPEQRRLDSTSSLEYKPALDSNVPILTIPKVLKSKGGSYGGILFRVELMVGQLGIVPKRQS